MIVPWFVQLSPNRAVVTQFRMEAALRRHAVRRNRPYKANFRTVTTQSGIPALSGFSVMLVGLDLPLSETVHAFENPLAACPGVMDSQHSDLLRCPEVLNGRCPELTFRSSHIQAGRHFTGWQKGRLGRVLKGRKSGIDG